MTALNLKFARTTPLTHPMGRVLRTPLLVPSFSSKGFAFGRDENGNIVSEAGYLLRTASEFLSDSVLVSAFDVHHGHIPPLARPITSITILDSGGYETSDVQDLSALRVDAASSLPWDIETYRNFLANWPDEIPSIVVSYDDKRDRKSIPLQIEAARELFAVVRGRQLTTFLIKPERAEHEFLDMDSVIAQVRNMAEFHVIGVTEKELGDSMLDRMYNVARLRIALDERGVRSPIHVFGSLDPLTVPLLFFAGAEIFDGLTWLRYGFHNGTALYYQNYGIKRGALKWSRLLVQAQMMVDNLGALSELTSQMQRFLNDGSFAKFGASSELLESAFDLLMTRFGGYSDGRR